MWKAGCMAILEECRKVRDIEITQMLGSPNQFEFVAITKRCIIDIINDRYESSIVTDVLKNAYKNLFVMREPFVFDKKNNRIILKRSNMISYIMNTYCLDELQEMNINDTNIFLRSIRELGFKNTKMVLISQGACATFHNCALDVIDASLILDNVGADTDAAE
jgi:hypothetical protein